jgi:hypothetical protein
VLTSIAPPSARTHVLEHVLPFELDVIYARVKYWAGDAHGYTDALGALLRRCRRRARIARNDADHQMWIERAARVGLIAASQFIEIKVKVTVKPPFFTLFVSNPNLNQCDMPFCLCGYRNFTVGLYGSHCAPGASRHSTTTATIIITDQQ